MRTAHVSVLSIALVSAACAGSTAPRPPAAPGAPGPRTNGAAAGGDPFALPTDLAAESFLAVPTVAPPERLFGAETQRGVGPIPAACGAFQKRAPSPKTTCSQTVLDAVLLDGAERDAALVALAACPGKAGAIATVLRADLAPRECADALLEPSLSKLEGRGASPSMLHAAWGLVLAGKLSRTVSAPPKLDGAATKDAVVKYMQTALAPWIVEQARSIDDLAARASKVERYGRAVAAVEASLADARFIEATRTAPIPDAWKNDQELQTVYYASLDERLEPRKVRARAAALEALKQFADLGVLKDERLDRARALVGKMYAGRRIDALDALVLPSSSSARGPYTKLPTFYADEIVDEKAAWTDGQLAEILQVGVPTSIRKGTRPVEGATGTRSLAVARVALAAKYWRASFADGALPFLSQAASDRGPFALALALHSGPEDAGALVAGAVHSRLRPFDTRALDANARATATTDRAAAATAAYNAGVLARAVPPPDADAAYFDAVAKRFRTAAGLFESASERALAETQARELEETARAVKKP